MDRCGARTPSRRAQAADPDLKQRLAQRCADRRCGQCWISAGRTPFGGPACRVTVVESGPGPSDPRVRTQISNGLRLPIGTASSVVRHYPTTLTDAPKRPRADHAGRGGRRIGRGQRRVLLPGGAGRLRRLGIYPAGHGPTFCRTSGPSRTDLDFGGPLHGTEGPILVRQGLRIRRLHRLVRRVGDRCRLRVDQRHQRSDVGAAPPPTGVGAVPLNINGGTRVGPGGRLPAAGNGSHEPHPAGRHPGGADPDWRAAAQSVWSASARMEQRT